MSRFVPELLSNVRSSAILKILKPYTRVRLGFVSQVLPPYFFPSLAKALGISTDECEKLLVTLILDNKLRGHIDQINQIVLIEAQQCVYCYFYTNTLEPPQLPNILLLQSGAINSTVYARLYAINLHESLIYDWLLLPLETVFLF